MTLKPFAFCAALLAALFASAWSASAATYNFEFVAQDIHITGQLIASDTLVVGSTTGYSVLSFIGNVTSTNDMYGSGALSLVPNPNAPDFATDAFSGLEYDNIFYPVPDLPGAYFDALGMLLRAGNYSYLFFTPLEIVFDPMEVRLFGEHLELFMTAPNVTATPLPATLPLFATGLGALGLFAWRRKRKAAAFAAN
jgi:hypothetical protein